MDLLGVGREGGEPAGDAVVEACADAQHHVAIVHGQIGLVGAVHAEHAEPVLAGRRIGAEPHQRRGDREAGQVDQFTQQMAGLGTGIDDAAAAIDDRLLRRRQQRDGFLDPLQIALHLGLVAHARRRLRRRVDALGELHILRDVDHHRPRPAGGRDMESLMDDARQVVDVLHQPVVFCAGPRDADRVAFLESVGTDQRGRHLPGQADQRDRIHQRVLQRRHRIGGARPRGHQHDAGLTRRARIALGGMSRPLLVADENVLHRVLLEKLVINRQDRAAGIAEQMLDAIVLERLDDHFGARHLASAGLDFCHAGHRCSPVGSRLHRRVLVV